MASILNASTAYAKRFGAEQPLVAAAFGTMAVALTSIVLAASYTSFFSALVAYPATAGVIYLFVKGYNNEAET